VSFWESLSFLHIINIFSLLREKGIFCQQEKSLAYFFMFYAPERTAGMNILSTGL